MSKHGTTRYIPCAVCGTHALTRAVHDTVYCPECKKRRAAENQARRRKTGGKRGRPIGGGLWKDHQGDCISKCDTCPHLAQCREAIQTGMPLNSECEPIPTVAYIPVERESLFDRISVR
jgi:hypothetical protein